MCISCIFFYKETIDVAGKNQTDSTVLELIDIILSYLVKDRHHTYCKKQANQLVLKYILRDSLICSLVKMTKNRIRSWLIRNVVFNQTLTIYFYKERQRFYLLFDKDLSH